MKHFEVIKNNQQGFTLVEMMISMLMAGIIIGAVYTSAKTQQDSYVAQDQVVSVQQNLRAAMILMTREIRMAGYDPTGNAGATITTATAGRFGFDQDLNEDGDTADSNESITFGFSNANDADTDGVADAGFASLGRDTGGGFQPIAENIHAVEFYYTLDDGTQTTAPADPTDIRSVQMTILAQSAIVDPKITISQTFTAPGGSPWSLSAGYRGRMATMTVQCRNMGL